jgi:excisionase family DNA binding protein
MHYSKFLPFVINFKNLQTDGNIGCMFGNLSYTWSMAPIQDEVLTLQECSAYLKIAESTIYLLARKGKIPCQKVGRNWRFSKKALDLWLRGEDFSSTHA